MASGAERMRPGLGSLQCERTDAAGAAGNAGWPWAAGCAAGFG